MQALGPVIGFFVGIVAAFIAFIFQEKWKARNRLKSIARAILAEASSARDRYMYVIGNNIEATPETAFPTNRATFREYAIFPIFEAHLGDLGMFPMEEASCLATVYTETSGYIQTLRNFLSMMDKLDEMDRQIYLAINNKETIALEEKRSILENELLEFWSDVRKEHYKVVGELFDSLRLVLNKYAQ